MCTVRKRKSDIVDTQSADTRVKGLRKYRNGTMMNTQIVGNATNVGERQMSSQGNFMIHLSVLYRNTQKYFDHALEPYHIGWGQLMFLFFINENEGITMQEVTRIGEVDKGTTTKSIQKLQEQGYVRTVQDENDKRVKRLFTTEKAAGLMNTLYELRNQYRTMVFHDIAPDMFEKMMETACDNSREIEPEKEPELNFRIGGLQKMTLLDYPGKVACTIFTAGCNFKCPFCHNRDLVFVPENYAFYDPVSVFAFLRKRQGLLDAVCISGGEPLMQSGLVPFVEAVKKMGYLVKLDTNGYMPDKLQEVLDAGLFDYVAMDIKNSRKKYAVTSGIPEEAFSYDAVERSIHILKNSHVDHEFRTTVVRELHTEEDLCEIAQMIGSEEKYYLQQFVDSDTVIQKGYSAYDKEEMEQLLKAVRKYVPKAELRGVKGD